MPPASCAWVTRPCALKISPARAQIGEADRHQLDRADQDPERGQEQEIGGVEPGLDFGDELAFVFEMIADGGIVNRPGEPGKPIVDEAKHDAGQVRNAGEAVDGPARDGNGHGRGARCVGGAGGGLGERLGRRLIKIAHGDRRRIGEDLGIGLGDRIGDLFVDVGRESHVVFSSNAMRDVR
jgi:hypothetical protein